MISHCRQFLRQGAAFRPRLERLESRDCPSCTVFQNADTLIMLGDETANQIAIADTREGDIVVTCDAGDPQRFTGVSHIDLRTLAGDDEITATFADPPDPVFHFRAALGTGDDRLSISGFDPQPDPPLRNVAFDIHAGAGDDAIAGRFSCPSDPFSFHFRADLGIGNDRLDINWFDPQPDPPGRAVRFDIAGGEGNDDLTFNMGDITINGQFVMNVNGGNGDDNWTMNLGNLMINGELVMNAHGAAGNDDLIVRAILPCVSPEGQVRFGLDGGAGDDLQGVLVNGAGNEDGGSAQILGTLQLDLHGGGGDDRTTLDIVTLDIRGAVVVNATGNRGADSLSAQIAADVRVFGALEIHTRGGAGNDTLDSFIQPCILPAGRTSIVFHGGAGDDRNAARIEPDKGSGGALDVRVLGGLGDDDLTLALFGVDDLALLTALLDGGREFDIARVTRNVRVVNCEEVIFLEEPR